MDKEQVIKLKNQALAYFFKNDKQGVTLQKIYEELHLHPFPITALSSYLDDLSYKGYLSRAKISGGRTNYRITREGKQFVDEGGYRGLLLIEVNSDTGTLVNKEERAETEKKRLFISYANDNYDKVKLIKKELLNHPLFVPYIVADKRRPNNALTKLVKEGIEASFRIIPLLSPQSFKEQWINQEIGYAEGVGRTILPIVEESVLEQLKGFVHRQNQCPYTYKSRQGVVVRDENKASIQCFRLLISDLEDEIAAERKGEKETIRKANQSLDGRSSTRIMDVI